MKEAIPYISAIFTFVGFLVMWQQGVIKNRERLTALETKMEVFWKNVAFDAANILHKPHPEAWEMDQLLERFVTGVITQVELKSLVERLKNILGDKSKEAGERTAASSMLRAIEAQYVV